MTEVTVKDSALRKAAGEGMDEFVEVFFTAIKDAVGGELNAQTMSELNSDQITLWAYRILRDEVMDGGNFGRHFDKKTHGYWRTIYDGQMRTISLCRFNFWESFFTEANFWLFVVKTIPKRIRYRTFSLSKIKEE